MKILYTPLLIVPALTPADRARILEAAGAGATLVETKDPARQREEIVDTDVLFGRVTPEIYARNTKLRYYHSIGAGVDAILTPELVEKWQRSGFKVHAWVANKEEDLKRCKALNVDGIFTDNPRFAKKVLW